MSKIPMTEISPIEAAEIVGGSNFNITERPFVDEFLTFNFDSKAACEKFIKDKSRSPAYPIIGQCSTSKDGTHSVKVGVVYLR